MVRKPVSEGSADTAQAASSSSAARPPSLAWAAFAAAAWALVFAVMHFYWATGGCVGLGDDCEEGLPTWFLIYDLLVGVLCIVGVLVALALVRSWGGVLPRRLAWIGSVVLALRGGVGIVQDGLIVTGVIESERRWELTMLYDPWFLLGAVLFGAAAWYHERAARARGTDVT